MVLLNSHSICGSQMWILFSEGPLLQCLLQDCSPGVSQVLSQDIDAFELWCWRRLLRVLWTARRSNQSTVKEVNPEDSLEGLPLNLKLQYFDNLVWTVNSLEKSLMLGKIEGKRRRGHKRMRWLDSINDAMDMNHWIWASSRRWWRTGRPGVL